MFKISSFLILNLIALSVHGQTYNNEWEEVNLIAKVEGWRQNSTTAYEFLAGKKLFGEDFTWSLTTFQESFLTLVGVSITGPGPVNDRFIQINAYVLDCDGNPQLKYPARMTNSHIVSAAWFSHQIDNNYVCPGDIVRFSINFNIYHSETLMYGSYGVISNEVVSVLTNVTIPFPGDLIINENFAIGTDTWGKNVVWNFFGDTLGDVYEVTLVSSDFVSGSASGSGWFKINTGFETEKENKVAVPLSGFKVGEKRRFEFGKKLARDPINVEISWETFGESARMKDYPVDDFE